MRVQLSAVAKLLALPYSICSHAASKSCGIGRVIFQLDKEKIGQPHISKHGGRLKQVADNVLYTKHYYKNYSDSWWFLNNFFKIPWWQARPPPPFMANAILNFHFFINPSLSVRTKVAVVESHIDIVNREVTCDRTRNTQSQQKLTLFVQNFMFGVPIFIFVLKSDKLRSRGGRWTSLDASLARCFAIFWNIVKTSHR